MVQNRCYAVERAIFFNNNAQPHPIGAEKPPMIVNRAILIVVLILEASSARAICPYDANCINNPYGGRSPAAPQGGVVAAPFGRYSNNQYNPDFSANQQRLNGIDNPYAPIATPTPSVDSGTLASPPFSGLGLTVNRTNSGLQGVDNDQRK